MDETIQSGKKDMETTEETSIPSVETKGDERGPTHTETTGETEGTSEERSDKNSMVRHMIVYLT